MKNILFASLLIISLLAYSTESDSFPFIVQDIKVEGLQRIELDLALLKIPIKIGDLVYQKDVTNIIKSLYELSVFENIKVLRDDNILIIQLKERPIIASISFSGNKLIQTDKLQQNLDILGITIGNSLDKAALFKIERKLEEFYSSVGRYNTTVKAIINILPHNRVDLTFSFTESVPAKIYQINFIGNEVFTEQELLSQFKLNVNLLWWNISGNNKYQEQILARDIEALKAFYSNQGYIKFKINSTQVSLSPDKKGVYITLWIDEGLPYTVKEVRFQNNFIEVDDKFKDAIPFKYGEIYNSSLLRHFEEKIELILDERGYLHSKVQTSIKFDDQNQEVSLIVNIQDRNRIYVNNIHFFGNYATKDSVLRREMRQMEGSLLNLALVDMGKMRLYRLGFFETVDVQIVPVLGTEDKVNVIYKVKELRSGNLNLGIGYGSESGINFHSGLKQENFFGSGNHLAINVKINRYQKNIALDYREPYFNLDGISFGGKIFYDEFEALAAGIVDYTSQSYGAELNWGFPFDELNFFEVSIGYTRSNIGNLSPYLQVEQFLISQSNNISSNGLLKINDIAMNIAWTRNNLNRTYFPTEGNYQHAFYKMTLPNSNVRFFKMQYDLRQYFPLTKNHKFVLLMRAQIGYGNGYGKRNNKDHLLPFYENYHIGGFSTLRGFAQNSAGPKAVYHDFSDSNNGFYTATRRPVGGNAIILGGMELIVPTPSSSNTLADRVRTSLFIDIASVWDTEFNYVSNIHAGKEYYYDYSNPLNYRASYGLTVQWHSPLGPLVFSFAKPIKIYQGDDRKFFTFDIARTF
ncbi:outer membrane protein assembly factor [Candidatus Photodesmus katoptron]|uniref:outer membrane protein assembly factor BamA n=1 Tax=Candidatus Photodesmus anomalopis TaxID=28176 RepID=UPI0004D62F94|nr:outer membrane protein assembly factor BamA [Candidatus Photodesmus katoptron]KEY90358.1 outer membrane protein assembly factor [Candidatus Photodesmus katoptron]